MKNNITNEDDWAIVEPVNNPEIDLKNLPFLFHSEFFPGESMISWMFRNAHLNRISPFDLYKHITDTDPPTDLDFELSENNLLIIDNILRNKAGCQNEDSLRTLIMRLNNLRRLTILNTKNGAPIFRYCPRCLSKKTPYFKLEWRFSFIIFCQDHNCWLNECCPQCGNKQDFTKLDLKTKLSNEFSVANCLHCGHPLNKQSSKKIQKSIYPPFVFDKQKEFMTNLKSFIIAGANEYRKYMVTFNGILETYSSEYQYETRLKYKRKNSTITIHELNYENLYGKTVTRFINRHFYR